MNNIWFGEVYFLQLLRKLYDFSSLNGFDMNIYIWVSLVAQRFKHLLAMWETWVQFLGQEDPWKRKWQRTPIFLPGESHGQRRLVGYSPWGHSVRHD